MDKFRIYGGCPIAGEVTVSGAKNSVLPLMAASLLTGEKVRLCNVPYVRDVLTLTRLLEQMGVGVSKFKDNSITLDASRITSHKAPYELVKTMRASVLVLGALLGRTGKATVSLPGGCAIGDRPINLHINGLKKLGTHIELEKGYVHAETNRLIGGEIYFDTRTVTGTENLMMAAVLAEGKTTLLNSACEPEVVDLANMLRKMGAKISGDGTTTIHIEGVEKLSGVTHSVIPDRIEAGTFVIAGCLSNGSVKVNNCCPSHLDALLDKLRDGGYKFEITDSSVEVIHSSNLISQDVITRPYPAFPTDMQAQYMVLMTQTEGSCIIDETIFENRFMHVPELKRMGANIKTDGGKAMVKGVTPLTGAKVMATDLRASASLVLAGLFAEGETIIDRVYHIDRGYEGIEEKFRTLGADIERIS